MPERETLYKVFGPNRTAWHGGTGTWPEPGQRITVTGELQPCHNGLHLVDRYHLVEWLGPELWIADYDGERIDHDGKVVVRTAWLVERVATWNETTARLFAADCAELVLPLFEVRHPGDDRPRRAVEVARRFARGEASRRDLVAARVAAWDAAWDAARAAAGAAARAAAGAAAGDAAGAAGWAAAGAAGWAAGWAAAGGAERRWQTDRLFDYLEGRA